MSILKPTMKEFFFSKTEKRVLLKYTEKFYVHKLTVMQFALKHRPPANKTRLARVERHCRLELRSIEHILALLGSDFMSNVKATNFRKTSELNARVNGLLQGEGETMDN